MQKVKGQKLYHTQLRLQIVDCYMLIVRFDSGKNEMGRFVFALTIHQIISTLLHKPNRLLISTKFNVFNKGLGLGSTFALLH